MSDEHKGQPIIIRRKKHAAHGHHGGAWKVAFADFMTAMMAFFLVLWLVGQKAEVRESVAGYFRDPGKFQQQGKSGVLKGSAAVVPTRSPEKATKSPKGKQETGPNRQETERLQLTARNLLNELEKQEEFRKLKKNIKVQLTSEGLRVILNESEESPAFFEPGSAKLLQKSAIILVTIARELGKLQNRIVVEGHTNRKPTGQKGYSNWELSADRANAARQLMEVSGLYNGQMREVRGFADKFPMILNSVDDPRNRRVTIVVLYKARERQYDQIEVGADLINQL